MSRVKELLKLAADSLKNRTLTELLDADTEYQNKLEEERKAYEAFENLELTEEQLTVMHNLIAKKDEREYEYRSNVYMAGLLDAYEILKEFELTRE